MDRKRVSGSMKLDQVSFEPWYLSWATKTQPVTQSIHLSTSIHHFFLHIICVHFRMQAHRSNGADAYRGMSDVFMRTYQKEGARGFYKGLFPNLLKVIPAASITYMVYEAMKKTLDLE